MHSGGVSPLVGIYIFGLFAFVPFVFAFNVHLHHVSGQLVHALGVDILVAFGDCVFMELVLLLNLSEIRINLCGVRSPVAEEAVVFLKMHLHGVFFDLTNIAADFI
jgi:hypothetical protein